MKNSILYILLWFFAVFSLCSSVVRAQDCSAKEKRSFFDGKYGIENELYKGKIFYVDRSIFSGHPFLGDDTLSYCSILINGTKFVDQKIRYDIYSQNFVLTFVDPIGAQRQIVLNANQVDTVYIGGSVFIKNPVPAIRSDFVQLIHQGTISCYVAWQKEKEVKSTAQKSGYAYSKENPQRYIVYDSVLYRFKNKREFLSVFPSQKRNEIKKYLSSNHVRMKKVTTDQLEKLIGYIETVL